MSRYISKLPPEIRELAEKRRSEQNPESKEDNLGNIKSFDWSKTPEGWSFWNDIYQSNYSLFYTLYPQKDCTCNSRTVDEQGNVVHFEECEKEKDKLDELIEWIQELQAEYEQFEGVLSECGLIEQILNKAKEIKGK